MFDFWTGSEHLSVTGFLIRAVIVYLYIFIILKVLGQRSLGALNPLDFLFGVIIGDVLGEPLSTGELPLKGPLAAAGLISGIHLFLSYIALKTPRFRRVIEDEPIILIERGRILHKQLKKTKVTIDSLMMDLRLRNASDLSTVDYAILEPNGQISVIKKSQAEPVTSTDLLLPERPIKGYPSVLIMDGAIVHKNLEKKGTVSWLENQIKKKGFNSVGEVFLMTMDEGGNIFTSRK